MKRACILYAKGDAALNRVLISKYSAALKERGYEPSLIIIDRLSPGDVLEMASGAEIVINRSRSFLIAAQLEAHGVFVTNPAVLNETANDKFLTYERLKDTVPMLETHLMEESAPPLPYPFVAKPAAGHGGKGVAMIRNAAEFDAFRAAHPEKCVLQKPASELGRDLRVYVIGGRPVVAMLRESKSDFRSNFSLGGSARMIPADELPEDVLSIVSAVCAALPVHYAGVDIIRDRGRAVLNEIEDPVGARMLYIHTGFDPAQMHVDITEQIISKESTI